MKTTRLFFTILFIIILSSICIAQKLPKIFWVCDGGFDSKIQSANYDGTDMFDIVSDLKYARSIALDSISNPKRIYFAAGDTIRSIFRVDVDGSNLTELVSNVVSVYDIELDLFNRRIFWASSPYSYKIIVSADMDIQNFEVDTLYINSYADIDIHGIGLDNEHGKLYWTEANNGGYDKIMRMNKDGSDKEQVLSNSMFYLSAPRDIDVVSDKIYWTDSGLFAHWVMQANLDGTGIDTILTDVSAFSIVINPTDNRIFWTEQMGIYTSPIAPMNKTFLFNNNHGYGYGMAICYDSSLISSVDKPVPVVNNFTLYQNYPNPFNPLTTIRFTIPLDERRERRNVTLKVHDILGNEIATLVDEYKSAGTYEVEFSPSTINHHTSSGIYFYQLKTGDYLETRKMILLK